MLYLNIALAALLAADKPAPAPSTELLSPPSAFQDDAAEEPPGWEGSVTAGMSITDGNTDTTSASATADAKKELDTHRWTLGLTWNFTEDGEEITQRKTFGRAQYDRFITEKMYWLAQTSAEADEEAGVDLRTTLGAGLGYQFRNDDTLKLSGEAGITWFNEEFDGGDDDDYMAARLAANWDYKLDDTWKFAQTATVFPSLEDEEDVYSKLDTRVKVTVSDKMFAQLQWIWDWDNTPAEGADRSDNLYLLTLGWKF